MERAHAQNDREMEENEEKQIPQLIWRKLGNTVDTLYRGRSAHQATTAPLAPLKLFLFIGNLTKGTKEELSTHRCILIQMKRSGIERLTHEHERPLNLNDKRFALRQRLHKMSDKPNRIVKQCHNNEYL